MFINFKNYTIRSKNIVQNKQHLTQQNLMKKMCKIFLLLVLLCPVSIIAQSIFTGTVVDSKTKQTLPGVNVVLLGTTSGTSTGFDGKFVLKGLKNGDKIIFSFVGYRSSTITFTGQTSVEVVLSEDSNELKEVVVQVGYGSVKKKDATGSVALITAKDFNKGAIISADQLLAGKAAGVRITNNGGSPDSAPNIRIRGGASLSASNNPLIIIDGVAIGDLNPAGVNNPFTLINPNDIESFSILKDASATAIYGIRGSNGVILITTKKGSTGAPQYNYSANISIGMVGKKLSVMDGPTFTRFIQQYYPNKTNLLGIDDPNVNDNPATPSINEGIDNLSTPNVIEGRILSNTDWQNEILRTSVSTDHNFSARANLYKKIPFRASLGFSDIQGLIKTNDYKRFNYSLKLTPKLLDDNLKIDINAKGTLTDKNNVDEGGALGGALRMDPTKPVYGTSFKNKFDGYYQETRVAGDRDQFTGATNPVALLNQRTRPERALRFLGNIEFDYKLPFFKNLRLVTNLGLDASHSKIREVYKNNALATYSFNKNNNLETSYLFNPGLNYEEYQTTTNKTLDAYAVYSKSMSGFVSKVELQGGYAYQNFKTEGNKLEFINNGDTGLREIKPDNTTAYYYSPLNLQGFFARTNLDFLGRYLFTATIRRDGTSLFTKENRWSNFPAVGFAWKVKEETFLKNSSFVKDFKLRAGWGKTGNANIPEQFFPSRLLFKPGNANSQYLPGFSTYTAENYNVNLTWEKTTTINIGLDFEFFKNSRFTGSIDYYTRKTNDLLSVVTFDSNSTASGDFIKNIGSLESNGLEFAGNIKILSEENYSLNIGGNIAYNVSKIIDLKDITITTAPDTGIGSQESLAYNTVGQQPFSAFVFEQYYDPKTGEPIPDEFVDKNGDGKINDSDKFYVPLRPNWTYGFNTTLNIGNFDFAANFRGQIGGQVYNLKKAQNGTIESSVPQNGNSVENTLNFYDGTANPLFKNFNGNNKYSNYLLENASFLRCDNISISYKFNKFIKKSILRLSAAVNNAFIITKYSGQDPENFNGIDGNFYPRPITYTFGLSLDF